MRRGASLMCRALHAVFEVFFDILSACACFISIDTLYKGNTRGCVLYRGDTLCLQSGSLSTEYSLLTTKGHPVPLPTTADT